MIELCTKRRMVLSIVILGVLTVVILILEEALTAGMGPASSGQVENTTRKTSTVASPINQPASSSNGKEHLPDEKRKECWLHEKYTVLQECSFCTDFEISSKTPAACTATGFKELLRCETSGTIYRSCSRVISLEKRKFWIFESLMLLSVVISYGIVKIRWSQLERLTVKSIERRLAAGH